ncbi:MAG: hypothetical protein ACRDKB_01875 [Actinomycetota bacterium]
MVSRSYEVEDFRFAIRTTSAVFGEWLHETLSAYRTRKKADPLYSVVVADPTKRKDRAIKDFHVLYRGTTVQARALSLATVAQTLLAEVESLGYRNRDDAVYAAAAPIAANGSVALVPAGMVQYLAGTGRQVARAGLTLPYVSAVALDPHTGAVLPSNGPTGVPEDAVARLADIGLDGVPSDRLPIREPLRPNFVMTMGTAGPEAVEPMSRGRAAYTLASSVLNLEKVGSSALETLSKVVSDADCYAVGGEAKEVLRAVAGLLSSSGS